MLSNSPRNCFCFRLESGQFCFLDWTERCRRELFAALSVPHPALGIHPVCLNAGASINRTLFCVPVSIHHVPSADLHLSLSRLVGWSNEKGRRRRLVFTWIARYTKEEEPKDETIITHCIPTPNWIDFPSVIACVLLNLNTQNVLN